MLSSPLLGRSPTEASFPKRRGELEDDPMIERLFPKGIETYSMDVEGDPDSLYPDEERGTPARVRPWAPLRPAGARPYRNPELPPADRNRSGADLARRRHRQPLSLRGVLRRRGGEEKEHPGSGSRCRN